jgi:predicted DNA-binding transcriptional regulator YafY
MPEISKSIARLKRINDYMISHSSKTAVVKCSTLTSIFAISLRQLRTDMKKLREKGAPLEYDHSQKGWRYLPGQYFTILEDVPLTGEELTQLRVAIETLSSVNNIRGFEMLSGILKKIHRATKRGPNHPDNQSGKAVYLDPLLLPREIDKLSFMLESIDHSYRISFDYHAFHSDSPKKVIMDPWFLRLYERRWYVGGFSHATEEQFVRVFPLDRIVGQPQKVGYCHDKPRDYDASSYWNNIYGITVPPDILPTDVILKFNKISGKYFVSSPFYEPFDILESSENHLLVGFKIVVNDEFIRKLVSISDGVLIVQPDSLREKVCAFMVNSLSLQTLGK